MRVLVVADEPRPARPFAVRLRSDGHAVDLVWSAKAAIEALIDTDYDGLVVAIGSERDALALVGEARRQHPILPMLVVASRDGADQRITAMEAGADDHLGRPIRLDELSLRVRKLVVRGSARRRDWPEAAVVQVGRVTQHRGRREVAVDGRRVALTSVQYALLDLLITQRDRVVSTTELIEACWDWARASQANPLPSQVSRLRRAFQGVLHIETVRGLGYRLQVAEPEASTPGH